MKGISWEEVRVRADAQAIHSEQRRQNRRQSRNKDVWGAEDGPETTGKACVGAASICLPAVGVKSIQSQMLRKPAHDISGSVIRVGTAGWTLPKQHAHHFPAEGTHLQRSAAGFNCVEINSSFHRPHMRKTWERWAACTPDDFRFAVKAPKTITHQARLIDCGGLLQRFLDEARGLDAGPVAKLGPLLVQLPPKLEFDEGVAHEFFTTLRELHGGPVVCEPRHVSWFAPEVDRMLRGFEVARVAADPPKGSALAAKPGGWPGLRYWRLHGAPRTYYSAYRSAFLKEFAAELKAAEGGKRVETWVIFDNTALGHGTENALELRALLRGL